MPVISFASPKGGVGKTTAALLLASELANKNLPVTVIDADPEHYIHRWGTLPDKPSNINIINSPTEESIVDDINKASQESSFVIIDLEGTANMLVAFAMAHSDLVIIPVQPSELDARGAAKALNLVKQQERGFKKQIPHAILFTRTRAAITTRSFRQIEEALQKAKVDVFATQLLEREVYRSIFSFGGTLATLNPKESYKLPEAILNAENFAREVVAKIKKSQAAPAQDVEPQQQTEVA